MPMKLIRWMIEALVSAVYLLRPQPRQVPAQPTSRFRRAYRMNRLRLETYTYQLLVPLGRTLLQVGRREARPRRDWV